MKRTLCLVSLSHGSRFYLIQNEQNNLELTTNPIEGQQPSYDAVVIADMENKFVNNFKEKFLSGEIFTAENVSVLHHGECFKSLKELLEKGLKIPPHQMPNIPNNHGHQMHNMAPVFNPQAQQPNSFAQVTQIRRMTRPNVAYDVNSLLYGNEYNNYGNSDITIINTPSDGTNYSELEGHTIFHFSY